MPLWQARRLPDRRFPASMPYEVKKQTNLSGFNPGKVGSNTIKTARARHGSRKNKKVKEY
jgi:hypothetical protein